MSDINIEHLRLFVGALREVVDTLPEAKVVNLHSTRYPSCGTPVGGGKPGRMGRPAWQLDVYVRGGVRGIGQSDVPINRHCGQMGRRVGPDGVEIMTNFNQHRTADGYADINVATSDDDLIAWVAEYGPMAQTCIKRAMDDPSNDIQDSDSLFDKIQAGHWEWLRDEWKQWRSDQDELAKDRADIEATDDSLRRWFCWQATH